MNKPALIVLIQEGGREGRKEGKMREDGGVGKGRESGKGREGRKKERNLLIAL